MCCSRRSASCCSASHSRDQIDGVIALRKALPIVRLGQPADLPARTRQGTALTMVSEAGSDDLTNPHGYPQDQLGLRCCKPLKIRCKRNRMVPAILAAALADVSCLGACALCRKMEAAETVRSISRNTISHPVEVISSSGTTTSCTKGRREGPIADAPLLRHISSLDAPSRTPSQPTLLSSYPSAEIQNRHRTKRLPRTPGTTTTPSGRMHRSAASHQRFG